MTKTVQPRAKKTQHRKNLTGKAIEDLGGKILNGEYKEGETLPPEAELAAQLGVGRGTLREAVKVLVSKGLLIVSPRRGTTVLPATNWHMLDPDVINWATVEPHFLMSLSEFRAAIEPSAASLAAKNITRLEAAHLLVALEKMQQSTDWSSEAVDADLKFHERILEATHNPFFISLKHALINLLRISFETAPAETQRGYKINMEYHEKLADAICSGDVEGARTAAENLMSKHRKDLKARKLIN